MKGDDLPAVAEGAPTGPHRMRVAFRATLDFTVAHRGDGSWEARSVLDEHVGVGSDVDAAIRSMIWSLGVKNIVLDSTESR